MKPFTIRLVLLTVIALCSHLGNAAEEDFARVLKPFFTKYCWDCHGDGTAEGGLDLSEIGEGLADEKTIAAWIRIYDRVRIGEMPPQDATQPSEQHRDTFTRLLGDPLTKAHAASKGTVLRRLNRREYQNTMNDIFGTHLDLVGMLPEDGRSHEFDNVGEALSISLVQMQRYLDAADRVLDAAIVNTVAKPESKTIRASYADTRGAEQWLGSKWLQRDDGAVVFFTESGYPSGMLREANVNQSGFYKVRVTGYAHQSNQPITFSIGATTFARGAEQPTFGYYSMPPGEPTTVEIQAWIESRYMVQVEPYGLTDRYEIENNGIENYKGPGLAILYVEVEGPIIEEYPSRGHQLLFDGINRHEIEPRNPNDKTKSWYKPQFVVVSENAVADVKLVLQRVATRAFRRPVAPDKVTAYVDLFKSQVEDGATIEEALRTAVSALFCSPDFLYLPEPTGKLDDYALASRLSYFLTRTLPDEELLAVAQSGKLSKIRHPARADRAIVESPTCSPLCRRLHRCLARSAKHRLYQSGSGTVPRVRTLLAIRNRRRDASLLSGITRRESAGEECRQIRLRDAEQSVGRALRNRRRCRPGDSSCLVAAGQPTRRDSQSGEHLEGLGQWNEHVAGRAWCVGDGANPRASSATASRRRCRRRAGHARCEDASRVARQASQLGYLPQLPSDDRSTGFCVGEFQSGRWLARSLPQHGRRRTSQP